MNPQGNHHPYCAETYKTFKKQHSRSWSCTCQLLKGYDKWRGITNKAHTASELRMMEKKEKGVE